MTTAVGEAWARRRERSRVRKAATPSAGAGLDGFVRDDPGNPLGVRMPMGSPLREDGESHLEAWARIVRMDPCAFCGEVGVGTLDHIEPRSRSARGLGGSHSWLNYAGACERCNGSKRDLPLLVFMARRRGQPRKLKEVMVMR